MLDHPSIVCRVRRPMKTQIGAEPGNLVAFWPGHPTHTIVVYSADGDSVVGSRHYPEPKLYPMLLNEFLNAALVPLTVQSERALLRVP